jgi:hypothetical protein
LGRGFAEGQGGRKADGNELVMSLFETSKNTAARVEVTFAGGVCFPFE